MAVHIYPKIIRGKTYYYLQRTWREKIDSSTKEKIKGSGKSRVRTHSVYLGTATSIMERLKQNKKPIEVYNRQFGFVCAVYQTAVEVGLVELLKKHIKGKRYNVPRWMYFMLTIINRLQYATSKANMGKWAAQTVLPDLLEFDPNRLNSKSFWYATDDVISEKDLQDRREKDPNLEDDLFVGIDNDLFRNIEEELVNNICAKYSIEGEAIIYDTTNFFTYIEEPTRSKLARTGHNKDGRHYLRQVGLAMCVDKEWGIPLFHRIYRGNSHDSKTFSGLIDELVTSMEKGFKQIEKLVLVLDKGNNSVANFQALDGKLKWIGSLVPSHFDDLVKLSFDSYKEYWQDYRYFRCHHKVMDRECVLVMTYNSKLAKKQEHSMHRGIDKLKREINMKWFQYKRTPKKVPAGIKSLLNKSRYKKYISIECHDGKPVFLFTKEYEEKRKYFGKNLLFSSDLEAQSSWIIEQYHAKQKVEDGFKLLKDPGLIRWRPSRHWTDTKIQAFGFCCVMALAVIRVMLLKANISGLEMSAAVLKEELTDLQEVTMLYDDKSIQRIISSKSSIQQRLWKLFELESLEKELTIH